MLRAASRGETGTCYTGFVEAYTRPAQPRQFALPHSTASPNKTQDGYLTLRRRGLPDLDIDLVELRMVSYWCETDSDQSYPATHEEEQFRSHNR